MNWQVAEPIIRLGCFALVLVSMTIAELALPRRSLACRRPVRWASNLGLATLNVLIVRAVLPLGAVGVAFAAEAREWGLFNNLPVPRWLAVILAFLAFDFLIYLQHVMFHAVPALWRLHMVHHADHDVDFSTGLRFHPLEILLSMGIKCAAVVLLGAPALSVLLFEVALNATAVFSHGNVRMPGWLDRAVRFVFVTPDMHRIHHSAEAEETNRNFGFNFSWWDYLLGTYRAQPRESHERMALGLRQFPDERVERLPDMLALPFLGDSGNYAITR
ncbi:MAG TPA: sterol desaturase family protein [Gemmataceae bacterium]|nr:sterol desaturase family protein [Gemmataceae bacterium]